MAGLLQIMYGIFKLGKFIRLVPYPVMLNFVNGLVCFLGAIRPVQSDQRSGELQWMESTLLYWMLGLVALTMAIIYLCKSSKLRRRL